MARDVQRVAIMDPADATRDQLRTLLLGMDQVWLEVECARYEFFYDVIRESNPDVAVISLDADQQKALQLIGQLNDDKPELAILAISAKNDGQAIFQALRNGAREFLTAPVVLEEMLTALQRLRRTRPSGEFHPGSNAAIKVNSQVISVIGSRGGVGCTTLAVNLGATLAQDEANSVALIDLDLALGDTDVALDLVGDHTLADIAMNIERLDMTFLKGSLVKHASGLSLLPHPMQFEDVQLVHDEHVQRLIPLLRASYSHLILDLSKSFSTCDVTALRNSDVILLVAQLELSSLRNVVRMLATLDMDQKVADKVRVIINRVGHETDITVRKAEETIGKPVYWQIVNDHKTVVESRNQGIPLVMSAPKSKVQQCIVGLAQALTGRSGLPALKAEKASWLGGIFSRSEYLPRRVDALGEPAA